jgi:hypothetical protein
MIIHTYVIICISIYVYLYTHLHRLAFGATCYEAILPTMRSAILAALMPNLNMMNVVGLVSIPGMMTGIDMYMYICIYMYTSISVYIYIHPCIGIYQYKWI